MIHHYPANSRYETNRGWLQSKFSFSFAEYYDPTNLGFGPLRVLNDDLVAPQTGFGMHPHRDMEIITFVLKGELEHQDDLGNRERMKPGIVQKMTAGRGIRHSEMNPSDTENVEFLQLWIEPREKNLDPGYEMIHYTDENLKNRLHPVISSTHEKGKGLIHQDCTLYLSSLETGKSLSHAIASERLAFLFVIEGQVHVNELTQIGARDSLRIFNEKDIVISANEASKLLLIDLP